MTQIQIWLLQLAKTYLVKNWRTSVVAVFGFIVTQFPQTKVFLESHGYSITDLQGLIILVIGFFAKDGSVTGTPANAVTVAKDPEGVRGVGGMGALLLVSSLLLPSFVFAQTPGDSVGAGTVDPGAAIADSVAQAAPEPRGGFRVGKLMIAPSASFSPLVISLKDFSTSVGPNLGAGYDVTWPSGYGAALHATLRDTASGPRPLASVYGIIPFLQTYGIRPGVSYQIGGGASSYRDAFLVGLAGASNFGFATSKR